MNEGICHGSEKRLILAFFKYPNFDITKYYDFIIGKPLIEISGIEESEITYEYLNQIAARGFVISFIYDHIKEYLAPKIANITVYEGDDISLGDFYMDPIGSYYEQLKLHIENGLRYSPVF